MDNKDNKKEPRRDVPTWRKVLYYLGGLLTLIGFLAFFSVFLGVFGVFSNDPERIFNFSRVITPFVGVFLIIIGQFLRSVGKAGLAGSGILLDPQREREEAEPFSRSKGGKYADTYDEFKEETGFKGFDKDEKINIMVRCPHCKVLNDEEAKFCDNCGQPLQ